MGRNGERDSSGFLTSGALLLPLLKLTASHPVIAAVQPENSCAATAVKSQATRARENAALTERMAEHSHSPRH